MKLFKKNGKTRRYWLLALGCLGLTALSSLAQVAQQPKVNLPEDDIWGQQTYEDWAKQAYSWTHQKWVGNDQPYREIRSNIDTLLSQNNKPSEIAERYELYKTAAIKAPTDDRAQFAWGYAAFKIAGKNPSLIDPKIAKLSTRSLKEGGGTRLAVAPVTRTLATIPTPYTYEFARLRFLLEVITLPSPELTAIGKRLVRHNFKDHEVMYSYIKIAEVKTKEDRELALSITRSLLEAGPGVPKYHTAQGAVYGDIYSITRDRLYKEKAIASYRKFLELAPADDPFREQAKRLIRMIQKA